MGQAIDLPDPMQNPALGKGPSADDLLAQLASEEIDRLLAEAEVERPAPQPTPSYSTQAAPPTYATPTQATPANSASSTIVIATTPPQVHPAVAAQPPPGAVVLAAPSAADPHTAAEVVSEPQAKVEADPLEMPPLAPIAETDVEELDARIAQELDTLFTELNSDDPPAPAATQPAPATVPATPAPAEPATLRVSTPAAPPAPADPVAQAAELQRQVLGQTLMAALTEPAEAGDSSEKRDWLGMILRPLEWLNRPLAACSDAAREALGKVAIMTLINALAILLYVLFLRKH